MPPVLPLFTMAYCYTRIILSFQKKLFSNLANGDHPKDAQREKKQKKIQLHILKTLVIVFVCYFLCWSLHLIVVAMSEFGYNSQPVLLLCSFWTLYLNSAINPLIYATRYPEFQMTTKELFCKKEIAPRAWQMHEIKEHTWKWTWLLRRPNKSSVVECIFVCLNNGTMLSLSDVSGLHLRRKNLLADLIHFNDIHKGDMNIMCRPKLT